MKLSSIPQHADRWLGRIFPNRWVEGAGERRHGQVGPAHLWRMKRAFQFGFLERMGLEAHHRLLDIGCGTLRGGLPIIEALDAERYVGVDVRAAMIEEAEREIVEAGLEARRAQLLHVPDLGVIELGRRFDFAWAFSVLIHLDDAKLDTLLAFTARHLDAGRRATFYANVNLGDGNLGRWQSFPVVARPLDFYADRAAEVGLLVEPVGRLRELGHVSGDRTSDAQMMLRFSVRE